MTNRIPAYAPRQGVQALYFDGGASSATPIIDWLLNEGHTAQYHGPHDFNTREQYPSQAGMPWIAISLTYAERDGEGQVGTNFDMYEGYWIVRGSEGEFTQWSDESFTQHYDLRRREADFEDFFRKPRSVKAVQITIDNIADVALFTGGSVMTSVGRGRWHGFLDLPISNVGEALHHPIRVEIGEYLILNEDGHYECWDDEKFLADYAKVDFNSNMSVFNTTNIFNGSPAEKDVVEESSSEVSE